MTKVQEVKWRLRHISPINIYELVQMNMRNLPLFPRRKIDGSKYILQCCFLSNVLQIIQSLRFMTSFSTIDYHSDNARSDILQEYLFHMLQ